MSDRTRATDLACPQCGAEPRQMCRVSGQRVAWAHQRRRKLADKENGARLRVAQERIKALEGKDD